jgi:peptidoglycan LD-endopeptidase CwlK
MRTAPGKIVTNAKGGYSNHNFGLAVDVVPFEEGTLNWNTNYYPLIGLIESCRII